MKNCIYCGKTLEDNAAICPSCERPVHAYKSIETYSYKTVSSSQVGDFETKKVGLFGNGSHKKMVEALHNGNVEIAPVIIDRIFETYESISEDNGIYYSYANISDTAQNPAKEAPRILDQYESTDLIHMPGYLLKYTLKRKPVYVVIDEPAYENLSDTLTNVMSMNLLELNSRAMPTMEGSIADRAGKFIGGLFKKKS